MDSLGTPRTLVAGGAGFVGSHLCERLLADGHEVICMDSFITGRVDNVARLMKHPRFEVLRHDVSNYVDIDGRLDFVLHLASPASPVDYLAHPIETLKAGSLGTHNLLGLAKRTEARFLLASTSEVYGDPTVHPQPEGYWGNVNPCGTRSVYDESKRFAEALTMAYNRHYGVSTRVVRIFNTYGPRMRPYDGRVVSNFVNQALCGEPLTVYGNGSQTRSFQYVDDLVEGLVRLLYSDYSDPVNIGNPEEFTILDLANVIVKLVDSSSHIVFEPLPEDDPRQRRPDIALAREVLRWEPKIGLLDGLTRFIDHASSGKTGGSPAICRSPACDGAEPLGARVDAQ